MSPSDGDKANVRCIVAVSGGIDSVVLLDTLVRAGGHELIVAHFDHGIRSDSAADGRFVEGLAKKYNLPFVLRREELGSDASEERARERRYLFLRAVAKEHRAAIVTAHHGDDIIETVAINCVRGTGWRGLAVLDSLDVFRPLLRQTKEDIRAYALHHRLEWVEDSTNASTNYLRNRIRRSVSESLSLDNKQAIRDLWQKQMRLKHVIDNETNSFLQEDNQYSRYLFTQIDTVVAGELLRAACIRVDAASPTRPQIERAVLAIKTARAHSLYEPGGRVRLRFTTRTFIVETP